MSMFNEDQLIEKTIRLANKIAETGIDGKKALKIAAKVVYEMAIFARGLKNANWK